MSKLLSVCIEDVDAVEPNDRYVRCVAVPGRQPGLRVDGGGRLLWQTDDGVACELWVSADDRLVLWRREGAGEVVVTRAGRSLSVPSGKPVMLVHGDEFEVGGRRLKVHLHGRAHQESPPEPILTNRNRRGFRTAATAVILGATLVAGAAAAAEQGPVEVRDHPPEPPLPPPLPDAGEAEAEVPDESVEPDVGESGFAQPPDEGSDDQADASPLPIEVRDNPPEPPPPPPPAGGCCSKQPGMASGWRRGKL